MDDSEVHALLSEIGAAASQATWRRTDMCPIHKGDVPVATVAYEADESGWRLFVVKTPGGFDGTAIAMGRRWLCV